MTDEFKYTRKFVIFKDKYTSDGLGKPRGYAKLEVRGNRGTIKIDIDNVSEESVYTCYLVGRDNMNILEVKMGRIIIDERGKGVFTWSFNPSNVGDTYCSIEKFSGIVVREGRKVLITGHIYEDDFSIEKYLSNIDGYLHEEDKEDIREEVKDFKENVEGLEKAGDNDTEAKEIEESEGAEEGFEEIEKELELEKEESHEECIDVEDSKEDGKIEEYEEIEKIKEVDDKKEDIAVDNILEVEKDDESSYISEYDVEEINKIVSQEIGIDEEKLPEHYAEVDKEKMDSLKETDFRDKIAGYTLNVLQYFPKIEPFRVRIKNYEWWRIDYDGIDIYRGFLPYYSYLVNMYQDYPFIPNATTCLDLITKYRHYLFGLLKEEKEIKYYMYGVPGKFLKAEHPFRGITGFSTWYEGISGYGYWILYIDALTGKVIFPLNPMMPQK